MVKIFDGISREAAFVGLEVKSVLSEMSEYFADMFMMIFGIVREYQNIIKIDNDGNIKEILEDVVHKMLKSCRCIS